MAELSLNDFTELCKLNLDKKHVAELYQIITHADCYFHPGIIKAQDHIASLYKFRLGMMRDAGKMDPNYVTDFERTVLNLQESKSKQLGITSLYSDDNFVFVIFYEPEHLTILGVLKGKGVGSHLLNGEGQSFLMTNNSSKRHQKYSKGKPADDGNQ
jgi:hypothetical protein